MLLFAGFSYLHFVLWFHEKYWQWVVLQAKAWGPIKNTGLQSATNLGITHLVVESEFATIINLLQMNNFDRHPLGTLLFFCRSLIQSFDCCFIMNIHSERNTVADMLAKRSPDHDLGTCKLLHPLTFICYIGSPR